VVTAVLTGPSRHSEILAVDVANGTGGILKLHARITALCTVKYTKLLKLNERRRGGRIKSEKVI
jgi:hypothetical protein